MSQGKRDNATVGLTLLAPIDVVFVPTRLSFSMSLLFLCRRQDRPCVRRSSVRLVIILVAELVPRPAR
jgi:hypothetical protein